ncbi:MAG TPA: MFS transporter [Herpetosiphonaceae bacterium]|nr:MFS transporter [Herpetosiphonaceae bacterium]
MSARPRPFYGWIVVIVASAATFASGPGQSYVFAIFVDPILQDTGLSRTTLSTVYAVGTAVSATMVFIVSRLVDRFGPRRMLATIAVALGSACFGMAFAAGPLALFLGFAALRALGQGSLPITATLLTAQWFVRYRGRAMAAVSLGFALSNAILPPLVRALIHQRDWRQAYMGLGIMVWILLIPGALWLVRDRPEDLGLHPDGAPEPPAHERRMDEGSESHASRTFWRSRNFWLLAIALTAGPFVITALVFHQVSIFAERGLPAQVAASVFAAFALAAAMMTLLAGVAIERFGPKRLLIVHHALLLLALGQLQLMSTPFTATCYALTLGAAGGMQSVTSGVAWAHYYGRRGLGRVQGAASTIMIAAAALAPLPLAAAQQASGGYTFGLALMAGVPVVCALFAMLVQPDARP